MVNIVAFQAIVPGSIPGRRRVIFLLLRKRCTSTKVLICFLESQTRVPLLSFFFIFFLDSTPWKRKELWERGKERKKERKKHERTMKGREERRKRERRKEK